MFEVIVVQTQCHAKTAIAYNYAAPEAELYPR